MARFKEVLEVGIDAHNDPDKNFEIKLKIHNPCTILILIIYNMSIFEKYFIPKNLFEVKLLQMTSI